MKNGCISTLVALIWCYAVSPPLLAQTEGDPKLRGELSQDFYCRLIPEINPAPKSNCRRLGADVVKKAVARKAAFDRRLIQTKSEQKMWLWGETLKQQRQKLLFGLFKNVYGRAGCPLREKCLLSDIERNIRGYLKNWGLGRERFLMYKILGYISWIRYQGEGKANQLTHLNTIIRSFNLAHRALGVSEELQRREKNKPGILGQERLLYQSWLALAHEYQAQHQTSVQRHKFYRMAMEKRLRRITYYLSMGDWDSRPRSQTGSRGRDVSFFSETLRELNSYLVFLVRISSQRSWTPAFRAQLSVQIRTTCYWMRLVAQIAKSHADTDTGKRTLALKGQQNIAMRFFINRARQVLMRMDTDPGLLQVGMLLFLGDLHKEEYKKHYNARRYRKARIHLEKAIALGEHAMRRATGRYPCLETTTWMAEQLSRDVLAPVSALVAEKHMVEDRQFARYTLALRLSDRLLRLLDLRYRAFPAIYWWKRILTQTWNGTRMGSILPKPPSQIEPWCISRQEPENRMKRYEAYWVQRNQRVLSESLDELVFVLFNSRRRRNDQLAWRYAVATWRTDGSAGANSKVSELPRWVKPGSIESQTRSNDFVRLKRPIGYDHLCGKQWCDPVIRSWPNRGVTLSYGAHAVYELWRQKPQLNIKARRWSYRLAQRALQICHGSDPRPAPLPQTKDIPCGKPLEHCIKITQRVLPILEKLPRRGMGSDVHEIPHTVSYDDWFKRLKARKKRCATKSSKPPPHRTKQWPRTFPKLAEYPSAKKVEYALNIASTAVLSTLHELLRLEEYDRLRQLWVGPLSLRSRPTRQQALWSMRTVYLQEALRWVDWASKTMNRGIYPLHGLLLGSDLANLRRRTLASKLYANLLTLMAFSLHKVGATSYAQQLHKLSQSSFAEVSKIRQHLDLRVPPDHTFRLWKKTSLGIFQRKLTPPAKLGWRTVALALTFQRREDLFDWFFRHRVRLESSSTLGSFEQLSLQLANHYQTKFYRRLEASHEEQNKFRQTLYLHIPYPKGKSGPLPTRLHITRRPTRKQPKFVPACAPIPLYPTFNWSWKLRITIDRKGICQPAFEVFVPIEPQARK